jgi:hypothetical protein
MSLPQPGTRGGTKLDGVGMRPSRNSPAIIISTTILLLMAGMSMFSPASFGQANPPLAPLATPGVVGAPAALATPGVVLPLAPAPGMGRIVATPVPTTQTFRCTCSGPGTPVVWSGLVSAPGFILARQEASGMCRAYRQNANATSPYIPPQTGAFGLRAQQQLPGTINARPPGQAGQLFVPNVIGPNPALTRSQQLTIFAECENCACN